MKVLKDLALALLNATIMLLVVLLLVATLFVSQVNAMREGIVSTVVTRLAPEEELLNRVGDQLEHLNARLQEKDCSNIEALRDEISELNGKLPDFSRLEHIATGAIVRQIVVAVGERLSRQDMR